MYFNVWYFYIIKEEKIMNNINRNTVLFLHYFFLETHVNVTAEKVYTNNFTMILTAFSIKGKLANHQLFLHSIHYGQNC